MAIHVGSKEANWRELEKLADEERKRDPRLTLEQSRANVYATEQGRRYLEAYRAAEKSERPTPEQVEKRQLAPVAAAKIDAAAVALQKADSSLSIEKARALAMERDPGLLRAFREEQAGGPFRIVGAPADESDWCRQLQISKSEHTIAVLAEARLVELTKAELARNQQLVELDKSLKSLTREGAFVVALNTQEGREAYEQLRRPDSHLTPQGARQAAVDAIEKRMADALAEMRKNDPVGYAKAFGSTVAAPAITAPPAAPVRKWQPYGDVAPPSDRQWVAKGDGGQTLRLRLLDPAGRSAAEIQKAWSTGNLELGVDAAGSWLFTHDAEFHGRIVKAGSVVVAVPA